MGWVILRGAGQSEEETPRMKGRHFSGRGPSKGWTSRGPADEHMQPAAVDMEGRERPAPTPHPSEI